MAHDVFISYSTKDKSIADAMCSTLEAKGIRCWIAPRDILPGMDWGGSIIDAITTSHVMVLLLSSNSNASAQVKREVERAVNKEVPIIPFRIEDVRLSKTLEYHLSVTHWMDALTPPLENHLQTLAEKVRQILSNLSEVRYEFVNPEPSSRKRPALFLGIGLVVGLMALASLVLWSGQRRWVPGPRSETAPRASLGPSIIPSPTLASTSLTSAPSSVSTPNLTAQLLLRIGGFEIQISNSGRSVATGIRVEVVGWQPGSPGVEIMERYSVPNLGPGSDFTLDRVLPPRVEPAPWKSRSGYIMVTCETCDGPRGWAFYIPESESGQGQQFFSEVSKSGSWPIAEFSYPGLKPEIGHCVNYPVGVCSGRSWIWNPQ